MQKVKLKKITGVKGRQQAFVNYNKATTFAKQLQNHFLIWIKGKGATSLKILAVNKI